MEKVENTIKKTYFFKRGDGFILACEETEAWGLMRGQGNWARKDFAYIGTSDGKTYKRIVDAGNKEKLELKEEIKKLKSDINKYLKTLERFKFEDLLDDDDPKVKRANELISKLEKSLEEKEKTLKKFAQTLIKKAFNAEVEVAKKDKTKPSNRDIDTPASSGVDRTKIINQLI